MIYQPDGWVIVKISGQSPHYRCFGSWRGGFATGDSWRLNSGIVRAHRDSNCYVFEGHSGSTYICSVNSYNNLGAYSEGVLRNYVENSGGLMECCEDREDWTGVTW